MAVIVKTVSPSALLKDIYKAIDDKKVVTWLYDDDKDLTHEPDQWKNKAWFRPKIYTGELRFGLLGQKNTTMTKAIYSVFHGRFIEMLLTHFDESISSVTVTSQKSEPDNFE